MTTMSAFRRVGNGTTPTRTFDLGPMHRPLWWAALALLLVNDNLLKGQGIVPGWLTGKLSDLAFLIVAPALLAALLPLSLRGRRVLALSAVTGLFVAVNLSPAASDAVVAAAARIGLAWRLWPDPTDLVTLLVLPATWWLTRPWAVPHGQRAVCEPLGVMLGAFACVATSAPPRFDHAPFLFNRTAQAQDITLTWLLRKVSCEPGAAEALAPTLSLGDLGETYPATLASGQVAALDAPPMPGSQVAGACVNELTYWGEDCIGVVVGVREGPAVLVVSSSHWFESSNAGFISCSSTPDPVSQCPMLGHPTADPGPDALALVQREDKLAFEAEALQFAPVSMAEIEARGIDPASCRGLRDEFEVRVDAAASCTVDTDCQVVRVLPIRGQPCAAYVNRTVAPEFAGDLIHQWRQMCQVDPSGQCDWHQPPHCRAGRCEETCPGVVLPWCPPPCNTALNGTTLGKEILSGRRCYGDQCVAPDGQFCTCRDGQAGCGPAPLPVAGCPLPCVKHMPLYFPPTPPDAGPDASTPDAATGPDADPTRDGGAPADAVTDGG